MLYVFFKIFVILYEIEMFVNKMIYVKYVKKKYVGKKIVFYSIVICIKYIYNI